MRMFISYSHEDAKLFAEFLKILKAAGKVFAEITVWEDGQILPGDEWDRNIREALRAADVVVALISPGFMNSAYIWEKELTPALERAARGECVVVPVIARATPFWKDSVFGDLQALPEGGKPMEARRSRGPVWTAIVERLITTATQRKSGAAPGSKSRIFHVPFPRNAHFTGRDTELAWLDKALGNDAHQPVALLAGMGGVGKTATAAEYAHRHRDDFPVVWWVEAETDTGRDAGFAALAAKLGLPEATAPDMTLTRRAVVEWMNDNSGWLVVFDNAEGPRSLTGWSPTAPKGRTLITSRDEDWRGVTDLIWGVKEWDSPTATAFLLERTDGTDREAAEALAERLGCLPLACEQAGAYITAKRISLTRYTTLFDANAARLLEGEVLGGHKGLTVSVDLSLESLGEADPLALSLLRVLARLAPDDIPRDLLEEWKDAEPLAMEEAVGALFRAALIRGDGENLSIHRLVRELIRAADPVPRDSDGRAMLLLAHALSKCGNTQTDIRHWPRLAALAPHAAALCDGLTGEADHPPEPTAAGKVCGELGVFFQHARGDLTGARIWNERALVIAEQRLAADDPELAIQLNNLGSVLRAMGDLEGAKSHLERALTIFEKHLGIEHPNVATLVNNLGLVLDAMGDLAGAKEHFERALAINENHLGTDHPNVATLVSNLGLVRLAMGDLAGAKSHLERALAIWEKALGAEHTQVAVGANNLGGVLRRKGDFVGAKTHFECALAIFEKVLPPEHPYIANVRHGLALVEAEILAKGGGTA